MASGVSDKHVDELIDEVFGVPSDALKSVQLTPASEELVQRIIHLLHESRPSTEREATHITLKWLQTRMVTKAETGGSAKFHDGLDAACDASQKMDFYPNDYRPARNCEEV